MSESSGNFRMEAAYKLVFTPNPKSFNVNLFCKAPLQTNTGNFTALIFRDKIVFKKHPVIRSPDYLKPVFSGFTAHK